MIAEADVPRGTCLRLPAAAIDPNPTGRDEVVWAVAVYRDAAAGWAQLQAHACGPDGDCAAGWCFEARVLVSAIRANVDGAR
ncbi:hypothetical protein AB0K35_27930 [Micromonospora sp. NPDC053740]|uniref:hypothetical protein n=1 Tax=Micromonospora sp. NPDC053740 TaxID=3155173 RepID=UPI003424C8A5